MPLYSEQLRRVVYGSPQPFHSTNQTGPVAVTYDFTSMPPDFTQYWVLVQIWCTKYCDMPHQSAWVSAAGSGVYLNETGIGPEGDDPAGTTLLDRSRYNYVFAVPGTQSDPTFAPIADYVMNAVVAKSTATLYWTVHTKQPNPTPIHWDMYYNETALVFTDAFWLPRWGARRLTQTCVM